MIEGVDADMEYEDMMFVLAKIDVKVVLEACLEVFVCAVYLVLLPSFFRG